MRVLVVDDEPLARQRIQDLLRREPDVESVRECGDGEEAVALARRREFDVMFLDVQMPRLDGFGVLERLGAGPVPLVIFVTAYERYALRAFEVQACDYLLKPFGRERFGAALEKARARLRGEDATLQRSLRALIARMEEPPRAPEILTVKVGERIVPVRWEEIDWVEAEGNYVQLHLGRASHLLRRTIASLEASLDPRRFRRIHRSALVNVDRIRELQPWFGKDYKIILRDGTELTLSRTYRDRLAEFLGND